MSGKNRKSEIELKVVEINDSLIYPPEQMEDRGISKEPQNRRKRGEIVGMAQN